MVKSRPVAARIAASTCGLKPFRSNRQMAMTRVASSSVPRIPSTETTLASACGWRRGMRGGSGSGKNEVGARDGIQGGSWREGLF